MGSISAKHRTARQFARITTSVTSSLTTLMKAMNRLVTASYTGTQFNDHECSVLVRPGCPPASPQIEDLFFELPTGVSNPKLGAPRCHCVCGPQYPDMDDCSSPELF